MGWWIALAILALLAMLPVGVCAGYAEQKGWVRLVIGPLRIQLYSNDPKKKQSKDELAPDPAVMPSEKTKTENEEPPHKDEKTTEDKEESDSDSSAENWKVLLSAALELLTGLRRKLRVNRLELHVCLAGEDPCDVALNYGRAWAAVGNFMPRLENAVRIGQRDIRIDCDFTAERTTVRAGVDVRVRLGQLVALLARVLVHAAKKYFAKNKEKAVQKNE